MVDASCVPYGATIEGHDFRAPLSVAPIEGVGDVETETFRLSRVLDVDLATYDRVTAIGHVRSLEIESLVLRSARPDDFDAHGDLIRSRLEDETLAAGCVVGQQPLPFVDLVEVFAATSDPAEPPVLIARFNNAGQPRCGVSLQVLPTLTSREAGSVPVVFGLRAEPVDVVLRAVIHARAPRDTVTIVGFLSVNFVVDR